MERTTAIPRNEAAQRTLSSARRPGTAAASVLALQASAGNQAVTRALVSGRTLARCSGRCTCGGACGRDELLEDELKGR
ncbi:MAG TPA: hypothetical protein VKB07_13205 [Gaiellaceae bacterium]|nr:hypothetical protein [Gaiellaceae bacterium]